MNGHDGVGTLAVRGLPRRTATRLIVVTAMVGALVGTAATPALATVPANDDFEEATELVGPAGSVSGSTALATIESLEPVPLGATRSVWYRWTYGGESPQFVTFDTCGSAFDTTLAVFTGAAVGSLVLTSIDDDACGLSSLVAFQALPGTTYSIQVAGWFGSAGEYQLGYPAGGIAVDGANSPPIVALSGPAASDEGQTETYSYTATDPDGDPLTVTESCGDDGVLIDTAAANSFECTFPDGPATSSVEVVADDGELGESDSIEVTISNVAPSITAISAPADPAAINASVNASVAFTDPGADTHTCTIDWGDGSAPAGGTVSGSDCAGSHSYAAAGVYTLTVAVTDSDGGSDSEIFEYVVVYDPNGGFVTGGGWVDSPAGAYTPDPSLSGKASFGFVSKYKKGATVPDGNTQFQFHAAGMNFHSTGYQWLVIAGPNAKYKGSGTINGAGDYGFMLTATDGQRAGGGDIDRFRIKIWDKTDGTVVYDNQIGDSDDAAASDAIEGGSIVIHTKK